MPPYTTIDKSSWKRNDAYELYRTYADPIFTISAYIDVTALRHFSQTKKLPFSQCLYYHSLAVCNEIEEFRLRISGDQILLYDVVHGGTTIPKQDGTFGFTYFDYKPNAGINTFMSTYGHNGNQAENKHNKGITSLTEGPKERMDLVRHTTIPWVSFTSVKHPRSGTQHDCIPTIAFGKFEDNGSGRLKLPVSVGAHHGLMDGLHAGEYINKLEKLTKSAQI